MCVRRIVTHTQEGEYVLEKQVNGQGVSPYDPSHNSTAVLVGKCRNEFAGGRKSNQIQLGNCFFLKKKKKLKKIDFSLKRYDVVLIIFFF